MRVYNLRYRAFFVCSLPSKCVPCPFNVEVLISFWQMLEAPQCGGRYDCNSDNVWILVDMSMFDMEIQHDIWPTIASASESRQCSVGI